MEVKEKLEKLNAWITEEQRNYLIEKAKVDGTSISTITRQAINLYKDDKNIESSIDSISKLLDKQITISLNRHIDRIVKLIVKTILSSESANHNSAQILASIKKVDVKEIKDTAYHYATNYLGGGNS